MEPRTPTPMDVRPVPSARPEERIESVVRRVEELVSGDIPEHVAAFEEAHRVLQEELNEAVDG